MTVTVGYKDTYNSRKKKNNLNDYLMFLHVLREASVFYKYILG